MENAVKPSHRVARRPDELPSTPLPTHEIIEGTPDARCVITARSEDENASAGFWSCDVGRYEFHFDYDEFVYLIEGVVTITDRDSGATHTMSAGDTAHFPNGSTSIWEITRKMTKYFVAKAG